jgi:DNA modification methylase
MRRVLRDDGTLWLNLGDSYAGSGRGMNGDGSSGRCGVKQRTNVGSRLAVEIAGHERRATGYTSAAARACIKPKDLTGIPWRVALALRDDGWYLRSDIIWSKPNPMPESVTDRPTRAHEYIFLLTKRPMYYYDVDAVLEPYAPNSDVRYRQALRAGRSYAVKSPYQNNTPYSGSYKRGQGRVQSRGNDADGLVVGGDRGGRNRRTVWTVATHPYRGAHFATFPEKLIEPCILAGTSAKGCCSRCGAPVRPTYASGKQHSIGATSGAYWQARHHRGDNTVQNTRTVSGWAPSCSCAAGTVPCLVLDPFMGSGTTAVVAKRLGRRYLGIELNPEYVRLAEKRLAEQTIPTLTGNRP